MSSESPLGSDYASSEQLATQSGQDQDGDDGNTSGTGGKKRSTSSGRSRAVSNLTSEQLARKRAHDRDAQRAIRLRTRTHIQSLEEKVTELESENGDLRRRKNSILRTLENLLREAMAQDPRMPANDIREPHGQLSPYLYRKICSLIELASLPAEPATRNDSVSSDVTTTGNPSGSHGSHQNNTISPVAENAGLSERLALGFVLQDQKMPPPSHVVSSPSSEASSVSLTRRQSQASNYPISPPQVSAVISSPVPEKPRGFHIIAEAHWEVVPRHLPATCPLDRLYFEFMEEQVRLQAAHGTPLDVVAGPDTPDATRMLYPQSPRASHPISTLMADLLSTYEKVVPLPERLAIFYVLYMWMRWAIYPTKHTYSALPDFIVPRPLSLFSAHPIWMDHVPFPLARDVMHANPSQFPNPEWSLPYTKTVSVNWPYDVQNTVMESPSGNGDLILHPLFAQHLRNLDNWSVGPEFMEAFPQLQGTMKVHSGREARGPLI